MNQPPTPEEIERNESESEGLVGLQPGQHFDPVGDARRELEKLKANRAAGVVPTKAP